MEMNKEEFMSELEKKLKRLPNEEKREALIYYKEYFEEAGMENEEKVIQELKSPSEIASQIMANYIVKETTSNGEGKKIKHSISTVWIIILAILASPIALPIAITIITLILVTWVVIGSFWITGVSLVISGIVYSILSFFVLLQDIPLTITMLGCGIFAIGLGILMTGAFTYLFKVYSSWITKKMSKLLVRKEKKDEK